MMMKSLLRGLLFKPATLTLVGIAFIGATVSGCSSTAQMSRISISSSSPPNSQGVHLIDARTQDSRVYRQDVNIQYLGDSNFQVPPVQLVAARLNEKLGGLLHGKEISLLEFQARISAPYYQTYPGMPPAAELLGRTLGLPQLGNPHYANVSLRGVYQQKEFSGAKSVQFYLGSGESEIAEAFEAAVSEAATNLRPFLISERPDVTPHPPSDK